jgi:REP element-mobilizing transposase RayT
LKHWDYSSPGYYFVSICIKNRQLYYFGKINNNEIILNNIGKIIKQNWLNISKHFNNIKLDEYIIMPNHMHGILQILNNYRKNVTKQYQYIHTVGTCHGMSLQNTRQFSHPQKNSLSMIINHFKSSCTRILKQNNQIYVSFWQPRFHDRVIRNEKELCAIRQYIKDNPKNWYQDRNFIFY